MSDHILSGRTEDEVLWFRRRGFLQAAAGWTAMGGFAAAQAQQRGNIVELGGDVLLNGQALRLGQTTSTGDAEGQVLRGLHGRDLLLKAPRPRGGRCPRAHAPFLRNSDSG